MRTLFIALFYLTISITIFSQEWTIGTTWYYEQVDFWPDELEEFRVFEIIKDTMVLDKKAFILEENFLTVRDTGIQRFSPHRTIISKEDSIVYSLLPDSMEWGILYDFGAQVGDTLDICFHNYETSCTSIRIDSVKNGYQYISHLNFDDVYAFIGPIRILVGHTIYFYPGYQAVDPFDGGSLLCFSAPNFYFPNGGACNLSVSHTTLAGDAIKIYPNPIRYGHLQIEGLSFDEWRIYNVSGQFVSKGQSNQIETISLDPGYYSIQFIVGWQLYNHTFIKL